MSYKDELECPHCHKKVDLEVRIESEYFDDLDNLYAVISPIQPRKGVVDCPINDKETHCKLELERRLGK